MIVSDDWRKMGINNWFTAFLMLSALATPVSILACRKYRGRLHTTSRALHKLAYPGGWVLFWAMIALLLMAIAGELVTREFGLWHLLGIIIAVLWLWFHVFELTGGD
jgi:hypothetical protein